MAPDTDMPEDDPVLYEVGDDHVATITLNRPHRRNAILVRMLTRLSEVLTKADDSADVRLSRRLSRRGCPCGGGVAELRNGPFL